MTLPALTRSLWTDTDTLKAVGSVRMKPTIKPEAPGEWVLVPMVLTYDNGRFSERPATEKDMR